MNPLVMLAAIGALATAFFAGYAIGEMNESRRSHRRQARRWRREDATTEMKAACRDAVFEAEADMRRARLLCDERKP